MPTPPKSRIPGFPSEKGDTQDPLATPRPGPGASRGPEREMFPPGTLLEGKFRIDHRVGRGAAGMVYHAWDVFLKRAVAVKALSDRACPVEVLSRFCNEAEVLARIDHPNVVKVFSFGEREGTPYFVMELLDGESLMQLIDRYDGAGEAVPLDEAIGLLGQVCRGLSAIHAQGIVHRDVKPANIMVTSTYRVALTDFGLVSDATDMAMSSMELHGTPLYLAPERVTLQPIPPGEQHLSDIYALGVTCFELLTGRPPFDADNLADLLHQHIHVAPPAASSIRADLPPAIDAALIRALAKTPRDRFPSADAFLQALQDAREVSLGDGSGILGSAVLVVDSDPRRAMTAVRLISTAAPQSTVIVAADARTALAFAREVRPEVIVLAADLPGMTAHDFCARLAKDELLEETRVIVVTPQVDPVEMQFLAKLGDVSLVEQPLASGEFLATLRGRR
jgi:serine/threonine-protein kinase